MDEISEDDKAFFRHFDSLLKKITNHPDSEAIFDVMEKAVKAVVPPLTKTGELSIYEDCVRRWQMASFEHFLDGPRDG